jgi:nucleoside-diphosphate-sugar epimerase
MFVTGATGFLGGAFLACLLASGYEGPVTCLVRAADEDSAEERTRRSVARFTGKPEARLPRGWTVLPGDLLSHEWHNAPAVEGTTHVMHLAANTSFGNNAGIRKANVEGALSVARAMRRQPLERYVHTGTATICGAAPPHVVNEDSYPSDDAVHLVPYTRSKAEAERLLAERYADLPVVVARPSIVVGHTQLGCRPSGSIFWVLRAVDALRFITWDARNRIDVIPVDWAATALEHLLFAPSLKHRRYHVSAGAQGSIRWEELAAEYARLRGEEARNDYESGSMRQLTVRRVAEALGGNGHSRHMRLALDLYYRFCSLDLMFDNQRLLSEGVPPPPRFTDYMAKCVETSESSIYEQMRIDLEPALTLV